ncbi:MAG: DNA-binding transcriptional regulator Fis [OM182 bacterium MED-G24]|uniref:Putative Fis-like DNA-binding protein n=1 Tax=OM182 bacterium MED-G24 TaxID=1986255 RepID=A0A2A5WZC6_9GAMM|nr:MAG: DNA-binding transcriptional regulator Fis [OM182 bacterium MED-G24]
MGPGPANDEPAAVSSSSGERTETLGQSVTRAVQNYLGAMEEQRVDDLYELVLTQVERPLLECALRHTGDNQSRAAELLGVSRGTLRARLKKYGML